MMAKTTSLNLRISPEFRRDIETLAAYHGLTMSSYAHSILVRMVRQEKEATPEAFTNRTGVLATQVTLAPVAAMIEPSHETKTRREIQKQLNTEIQPKKRKAG